MTTGHLAPCAGMTRIKWTVGAASAPSQPGAPDSREGPSQATTPPAGTPSCAPPDPLRAARLRRMSASPHAPAPAVRGLRIGALRGVPVYIGASWPVIALVLVALFGPQVHDARPDLGAAAYAVAGAYALLLLVSVLVHEAAHALVGQWRGYRVSRIVADLWGGHTAYDHADTTPASSALVAAAGPLANAVLAGIAWLVLPAVPAGVPSLLVAATGWSNGFVALFNLLPGLPLDGGFLLEALVWRLTGSRSRALVVAGWSGRAVVLAVVAWFLLRPLLAGSTPGLVQVLWTLMIGSFLWTGASAAVRSGRGRAVLDRVELGPLLRPVTVLPQEATADHAATGHGHVAVASPQQGPWGLVDPRALAAIPAHRRGEVPVTAVTLAQPAGWVAQVDDTGDVTPVVAAFQTGAGGHVLVRRGEQVLGVVAGDELGAALRAADPAHRG